MKTIVEYLINNHVKAGGPVWAVICNQEHDEITDWLGPYNSEEECLKDLEYADINTKKLFVKSDDLCVQIIILPEEELVKRLKAAHLYDEPLKANCSSAEQFAEHWLNIIEF